MKPEHASFTLRFVVALLTFAAIPGVPAAEQSAPTDAQLYWRFCASCHGTSGVGNGPLASLLKRPPPDLTQLALRNGGIFPAEQVSRAIVDPDKLFAHGSRDMPVWGIDLGWVPGRATGARIKGEPSLGRLVDYIESVQKNAKQ